MKIKLLTTAMLICTALTTYAQCLNGGCDVGMSRSAIENGVFVGHYEDGEKLGLGISYLYNPEGSSIIYANYINDKPNGVVYQQDILTSDEITVHTFKNHQNGSIIYPAFRFTKENKKTKIEVAFKENDWKKYEGDQVEGELQIKNVLFDGSPAFLALNGKDQVMALSATISHIELLSSEPQEKYYNPLQLSSKDNRLVINVFPKAGADETEFKTSLDWDMEKPQEAVWYYKRYFNNELVYKFNYEDVLELPSAQDIKQQKLEKAFEFIAEQVDDYDFEKGYEGKAKDFIDILNDIKERAARKGLTASSTYDITMTKLHLINGDKVKSLQFAQNACDKTPSSYDIITNLIKTEFTEHTDILPMLKKEERLAAASDE
ncbi:hypothetical protein [Dokdonia sp. Hel_I_53]|uniref:hypothetical protein n=1 Tax=Dokdonia sp. Hel_I_53 TaxID=1566287 RepID=UPI00119C6960|nr:hypothetical protein [Dokdonia sp. Hel_I_53]TVZ51924.1 hypothetical protein OD90_1085 [Dokdonia sp. Hel_I_53]